MVVLIHAVTKTDTLAPVKSNSATDASTEGLVTHERPVLQRQLTKARETHINLLELETLWKACQQFRERIKWKVNSFKIDNTTTVS